VFEISLTLEGVERVDRMLRDIEMRLTDLTPIWPKIRDAFWEYEKQYLSSRGFGTFAPLKPGTLKNKKRGSDARPFYTLSRAMVDSLTGRGPMTYYRAEPQEMEIGVGTGPAHWHMLPRKFMTARPPIKATTMIAGKAGHIVLDYIANGKK